jgi:hypothetical protein
MNQLPQRVFIGAECVNSIEAGEAQAAEGAAALLIERKSIEKRSLAVGAVVLGFNCSGLAYTSGANGDPGNFAERQPADAAIIREKAAENLFCERQNRPAEIGQQGT